eukprot:scaffold35278_cov54-Attheya_sp.AAC.3
MSANTRAAERGTIRKAAESPDEIIVKMRFDLGLCVTCNTKLFEVIGTGGHRKLNPVTTSGVSNNGRCLYCHPDQESHSVKEEEEQNWEDAATVSVEEVETGEDIDDQSLPPVIALGRNDMHFVGVVLEGNVKKGKGVFSHVLETGELKLKLIVYKGEFADGFFEGRGSYCNEGVVSYGCEGQWKKSKLHGHCKETFENGNMYEGEMKNGMMDGEGTYTEVYGRYEGNWKDDKRDGQGTYTWANGGCYEGEFKNNMHHGNGKRVFVNGTIYEGNWKNNQKDGHGIYTWAYDPPPVRRRNWIAECPPILRCNTYEGEWKKDRKNGYGKRVFVDGAIYEGNWKDDKRDGRGTLRYPDGRVKYGTRYPDGRVKDGTWKNDKFVG